MKEFKEEVNSAVRAEKSARKFVQNAISDFQVDIHKLLTDFKINILLHKNHTLGESTQVNGKVSRNLFNFTLSISTPI